MDSTDENNDMNDNGDDIEEDIVDGNAIQQQSIQRITSGDDKGHHEEDDEEDQEDMSNSNGQYAGGTSLGNIGIGYGTGGPGHNDAYA